jgi:hypothetical protein
MENNIQNQQESITPPQVSTTMSTESNTSMWIVILLLIFFQPAAWYFMYKEKRYNIWFSYLIWIYAIPLILLYIGLGLVVIPKLMNTYKILNIQSSMILNINLMLGIFIFITIVEIIAGVVILKRCNKQIGLSKGLKWLAVVILSANLLMSAYLPAYTLVSVISPIYNLNSNLQVVSHSTIEDISGWKTYTNSEGRFSIEYPSFCSIEKSSELFISSDGVTFCKEHKDYLPSINIYYSPLALVEKEVVSRNYSIPVEQLQTTKETLNSRQMVTIMFKKDLITYYHSLELGTSNLIIVARGSNSEMIFRQMIKTLKMF